MAILEALVSDTDRKRLLRMVYENCQFCGLVDYTCLKMHKTNSAYLGACIREY